MCIRDRARLAEHPEQRARLAENPEMIPAAYDEILRYDMPTQFLCRTITRDIEIHGQTMKKDQGLIFLYASANRDEREFDDPDTFDIRRKPPRILSFGAGPHQCLGTHVARMEGKVCLEAILDRFPEYELDLDRATRFKTEFVQGFQSLPFRPTVGSREGGGRGKPVRRAGCDGVGCRPWVRA